MPLRKDVYQVLCLYRGTHPKEALDPFRSAYEEDGVTFRPRETAGVTPGSPRIRSAAIALSSRSQLPPRLDDAYDIAIADGLLEEHLLKNPHQLSLYKLTGAEDTSHFDPTEERPWPMFPEWDDWLVHITPKGRGALAAHDNACELMPEDSSSGRRRPLSIDVIEALLGKESRQIIDIALSDQRVDDKIRIICGIDRQHLCQESPWWAGMFGVSDAAVRKTQFWKVDRDRAIEADREMRGG